MAAATGMLIPGAIGAALNYTTLQKILNQNIKDQLIDQYVINKTFQLDITESALTYAVDIKSITPRKITNKGSVDIYGWERN